MVRVKTPMPDMNLTVEAALYVAILERQVTALTLNDMKYRAMLEMLTGENWDDMVVDFEEGKLREIAIRATEAKLGVAYAEAHRIVREREQAANAAAELHPRDPRRIQR